MEDSLHVLALSCVKNYKKSESNLIDVLCRIDKSRMYLSYGVPSLFAYCVKCLGLSESETSRFIQVTRKSFEVPELKKTISDGVLTVSKASRISSVITSSTQEEWIGKASTLTHRELEKEVVKVNPRAAQPESIRVITPEVIQILLNVSLRVEEKFKRSKEVLRTKSLEDTLEKMADLVLQLKDPVQKA